eukprot:Sspe_Gene.35352::Locus_17136_Transcript_1_1_Confidence_1.000_Length_2533::g.35352::m.35352
MDGLQCPVQVLPRSVVPPPCDVQSSHEGHHTPLRSRRRDNLRRQLGGIADDTLLVVGDHVVGRQVAALALHGTHCDLRRAEVGKGLPTPCARHPLAHPGDRCRLAPHHHCDGHTMVCLPPQQLTDCYGIVLLPVLLKLRVVLQDVPVLPQQAEVDVHRPPHHVDELLRLQQRSEELHPTVTTDVRDRPCGLLVVLKLPLVLRVSVLLEELPLTVVALRALVHSQRGKLVGPLTNVCRLVQDHPPPTAGNVCTPHSSRLEHTVCPGTTSRGRTFTRIDPPSLYFLLHGWSSSHPIQGTPSASVPSPLLKVSMHSHMLSSDVTSLSRIQKWSLSVSPRETVTVWFHSGSHDLFTTRVLVTTLSWQSITRQNGSPSHFAIFAVRSVFGSPRARTTEISYSPAMRGLRVIGYERSFTMLVELMLSTGASIMVPPSSARRKRWPRDITWQIVAGWPSTSTRSPRCQIGYCLTTWLMETPSRRLLSSMTTSSSSPRIADTFPLVSTSFAPRTTTGIPGISSAPRLAASFAASAPASATARWWTGCAYLASNPACLCEAFSEQQLPMVASSLNCHYNAGTMKYRDCY